MIRFLKSEFSTALVCSFIWANLYLFSRFLTVLVSEGLSLSKWPNPSVLSLWADWWF